MKARKWIKVTVVLNLAFCAILSVIILQQRNRLGAVNIEFANRVETLRGEENRLHAQLQQVRAKGPATSKSETANEKPASAVAQLDKQTIAIADRLRTTPDYIPCLTRNARRTVMRQYGDAIEALGLSRETSEQLKVLLTQKELSITDANLVAQQLGIGWNNPPSDFEVQRKIAKETETGIRSLLGEDGYAAYREQLEFQRLRKSVLDQCNVGLTEHGVTPLNGEQLLACFRAHSRVRVTADHPTTREEWAGLIRPQITDVMSADQLEAYVDYSFGAVRRRALGAALAGNAMKRPR